MEIVFESPNKSKAFNKERQLIAEIGLDKLANARPGGEGDLNGRFNPMYGKERSKDFKSKMRRLFSKPVYKVSTNGKVIKKYSSPSLAEKDTGIKKCNIVTARNRLHKAGGYYWIKEKDLPEIKNIIKRREKAPTYCKKTAKLKSGKIVEKFSSISEINRKYGYDISLISKVCRGKKDSAYGFGWKFI